jgi:rhomboid protease GluP
MRAWGMSMHQETKEADTRFFRPLPRDQAELWSLVLSSRSVPHRILAQDGGYRIHIEDAHKDRAIAELEQYERENRDWLSRYPVASAQTNAESTLWTLLILTGLFSLSFSEDWRRMVLAAGSGDSTEILKGQWWRLVTALTLHADPVHLLGNMTIGGFMLVGLCSRIGTGLGWTLTLLAGVLGNLLNTFVHGAGHNSIGASTAVFGAVGITAGIQMASFRNFSLRNWVAPLGAGLALMGLLGAHGERTDLGAHLFGFAVGLILGGTTGKATGVFGLPNPNANRLLGIIAAAVPILAWVRALR